MTFDATSPVHFHFQREGGAVIGSRLTLWQGVGGPNPRMVASADFGDPVPPKDDRSVVLAPGATYTCVMSTFVHKALDGRYRFSLQVDDQPVFAEDPAGDVSDEPQKAVMLEAQFDIRIVS